MPALVTENSREQTAKSGGGGLAGNGPQLRRRGRDRGLGLIEEAYCLLRSAGPSAWLLFYVGAVPFVAVIFYFWADMSRSSFAAADAVWAALLVSLSYFWMKSLKALFCRRLWSSLHAEGELPKLTGAGYLSVMCAHALLQALALPLLILSLLFVVPLAWVYAFFHNATVLCLTRPIGKRPLSELIAQAAKLSHWRWGANHLVMAVAGLAAFLLWVNVVMFSVTAPQLVRWVFGVETVFTLFPLASLANTTFLFGSLLVTWLMIAPLTHSIYVVRCFYGGSRRSGADLLGRLASLRSAKSRSLGSLLLICAFCSSVATGNLRAQDSGTASVEHGHAQRAAALDGVIEDTLRGKSYQWRLSRDPKGGQSDEEREPKGFAAAVQSAFQRLGERIKQFVTALFQPDENGAVNQGLSNRGKVGFLSSVMALISLGLVLALIGWAVAQVKKRGRLGAVAAADGGSGYLRADEVDLEHDGLLATQLPEHEWLRLARMQIEAGEFRLAVRALFLGCLANLGERGVIQVARHKSNRDYLREVDRRARESLRLREAFAEGVLLFDRSWYGRHTVSRGAATRFAELCEAIAADDGARGLPSSGIGDKNHRSKEVAHG